MTVEGGKTRFRRAKRGPASSPGQLSLFGPARLHTMPARRKGRKSETGLFESAVALDLAGDAGARDAYRRAIDAGDRPADAWCNLGVLEAGAVDDEGAFTRAIAAFAEALALDAGHAGAHFDLGCLYLERAEPAPARVHVRVAAASGAGPEATLHLALACAMLGDVDAAGAALAEYEGLAGADESAAANTLVRRLLGR